MNALGRAVCVLLMLWTAPLALAQSVPLKGWTLTFFWSPEYCNAHVASREPQCTEENYFVIGGLQPEFTAKAPTDCPDRDALDREKMETLLWIVPNRVTLKSMWSEQGSCSGLERDEYFRQVARAQRRVVVPSQYRGADTTLDTKVVAVRKAFVVANPGLKDAGVSVSCKGSRWLREVRVCLDPKFEFRSCAAVAETCDADIRLRQTRTVRRP